MASISRISFTTDMTSGGAMEIPLGVVIDCFWPDRARWLGLVGRRTLTAAELALVNLQTWPELEMPFKFLESLCDKAWSAETGSSVREIFEQSYSSSALSIRTEIAEYLAKMAVDSVEVWADTKNALSEVLTDQGEQLLPTLLSKVPGAAARRRKSGKKPKQYPGTRATFVLEDAHLAA